MSSRVTAMVDFLFTGPLKDLGIRYLHSGILNAKSYCNFIPAYW
ncbi:hypothetical protein EC836_101106 [Erwinia sp. JUb26]|nr:hypothetical protein EC836_101106 [Erwinia sp. JUb26]